MTAATPANSGKALLDAISQLIDVLDRENAALGSADREVVRRLADEKHLSCRAYEAAARAFRDGPGVADLPARPQLRRALARLADASAENRRRLAAALAAHRRLMEVVADALQAQLPAPTAYARGGRAPSRARLSAPPAFGFDRAL